MSVLVVLFPPRPRAGSSAGEAVQRPSEFHYVLSPDGQAVGSHGRAAPALLPRADTLVAVLPETDVSWHRITVPKAPSARLRAALLGVLEDALLDEPESLHVALAPNAAPGQAGWVAAVHKGWLSGLLQAFDKVHRVVDRVVPMAWPDAVALGHFHGDPAAMRLTWSGPDGVATVALQGGLARALLPQWQERAARWSATPAVAAPAERWLGEPVAVLSEEQRALQAARSLWNLRQFDLAPRHRGTRVLRDAWRHVRSPDWRPVRWGLVALAGLQLAGLNLWAWHQRVQIDDKKAQMVALLKNTHPQVRAVIDAPAQMQRETEVLRAAAGRPGESDLETLLLAAASAWPEGAPPVQTLRFEPGRLTLSAAGWTPAQIDSFRGQLRLGGWHVETVEGRLVLSRAPAGAAS